MASDGTIKIFKTAVTAQDHEAFLRAPTLASQLPYRFSSDRECRRIRVYCPNCVTELDEECIHGTVAPYSEGLLIIEGYSYCTPCDALSKLHLRVYADGRILAHNNKNWQPSFLVAQSWMYGLLLRIRGGIRDCQNLFRSR